MVNVRLCRFSFAAAVFAMAGVESRAETIYVTVTGAATKFGSFDTTTGAFTGITTSGVGATDNLNGLTWDADTGGFQVIVSNAGNGSLKNISLSGTVGGTSVALARGGDIQGIAATGSAATLYTFVNGVGAAYQLGTTNRSSGAWTTVSGAYSGFALTTFPQQFGAMSYAASGLLYASGNTFDGNFFGRMDTSTGLFTQIGAANNAFNGMALASNGTTLYGITSEGSSPGIYSVDLATGVPTLLTSISGFGAEAGIVAAGMAASPVPEPATAVLLAAAAIGGVTATVRRVHRVCA
jgi:hypothetical protein